MRRVGDPFEGVLVEGDDAEVRADGALQVTVAHEGSRPKASTRSSAHGQPAAMRPLLRRAEETKSPAACKSV